MRALGIVLLIVVATASLARAETDYSAPLSPRAVAFKQRFADRRPVCQEQAASRLGLTSSQALSFCDCQIDVFARALTPGEMKAVELATFGTSAEIDANAPVAAAATSRLVPERKRVCGY